MANKKILKDSAILVIAAFIGAIISKAWDSVIITWQKWGFIWGLVHFIGAFLIALVFVYIVLKEWYKK